MQTTIKPMTDKHTAWLATLETHQAEVRQKEAQNRKQAIIDDALKSVPPRFLGKTFADYHIDCPLQAEVKKILMKYAETFPDRFAEGTSLIFTGKIGTGKTLFAYILYQLLIKKGHRVEFQTSLSFLRLLQEKQFESFHAFENHLQFYKELPFLIIDEATEGCGKGAYPADWERNIFRMLIDIRYQAKRPTLIITNRDKKELTARLGGPTIDRLSENGITLAFNWQSYRQK
jgi:DNA replication protein DnaC